MVGLGGDIWEEFMFIYITLKAIWKDRAVLSVLYCTCTPMPTHTRAVAVWMYVYIVLTFRAWATFHDVHTPIYTPRQGFLDLCLCVVQETASARHQQSVLLSQFYSFVQVGTVGI